MDPNILLIIIAIVALILVLDVYKRQNDKITNNLHVDNRRQFLTLSALEYRNQAEAHTEIESQLTVNEITRLISSYERGEMSADVFQRQMDYLLNKYN